MYYLMNWTQAALACRAFHRDAHLLVINDEMEQYAVAGIIDQLESQCSLHHSLSFIIIGAPIGA